MPYTKLDDRFWSDPRIVQVGNAAAGALCRMTSYCGQQLSDGHVPTDTARFIARPSELKKLSDAGLIVPRDDGWEIAGYLDPEGWDQVSRETVEKRRAATRDRVKRHRNGGSNAVTGGVSNTRSGSGVERSREDCSEEEVFGEGAEFSDWLSHFESLTGNDPSPQTESDFEARRGEGHSLDDLKLATAGIAASDWHRENGYVRSDFILRADKVAANIARGSELAASFTDDGFGRDVHAGKTRDEMGIA